MDSLPQRSDLADIVACPRCLSRVVRDGGRWRCDNAACPYATAGFPSAGGQPVFVDFDNSVFQRCEYDEAPATLQSTGVHFAGAVHTYSNRTWRDRARGLVLGTNRKAEAHAAHMLLCLKALSPAPRLLIIGGGALGEGTRLFYDDPDIEVVGTDVYPSPHISLLADGHALPFRDGVFDGVWIQAVLEHVLEPARVVAQIHRVLKPGGLVYAETPFMFPVHMGAYDFTRFTPSGHRWLFHQFEQVNAGLLAGAGTATLFSIRFLWRALGLNDKVATLLTAPVFWLRYLDRLMRGNVNADASAGVYFLGRKAGSAMSPHDIIAYYRTQ